MAPQPCGAVGVELGVAWMLLVLILVTFIAALDDGVSGWRDGGFLPVLVPGVLFSTRMTP